MCLSAFFHDNTTTQIPDFNELYNVMLNARS
jgi:hypothetical protein